MFDAAKIPAADVMSGTILGLSYWVADTWSFPKVDPEDFFLIAQTQLGKTVHLTAEGIFAFTRSLGEELDLNLGAMSLGSVPVYLNYIRKGKRPNNKGRLPGPVPVSWTRKTNTGVVSARSYAEDVANGLGKYMPMWLF